MFASLVAAVFEALIPVIPTISTTARAKVVGIYSPEALTVVVAGRDGRIVPVLWLNAVPKRATFTPEACPPSVIAEALAIRVTFSIARRVCAFPIAITFVKARICRHSYPLCGVAAGTVDRAIAI